MSKRSGAGGPSIAALRGIPTADIQILMAQFAKHLAQQGLRVAGLIETIEDPDSPCSTMTLQNLADGSRISISLDLGPGSEACRLDNSALALACGLVQASIREGADVVFLSKFGKVEAQGEGFVDAFADAILADIPIITSVAAVMQDAWHGFAGEYAEDLPATVEDLQAWWLRLEAGADIRR